MTQISTGKKAYYTIFPGKNISSLTIYVYMPKTEHCTTCSSVGQLMKYFAEKWRSGALGLPYKCHKT